MAPGTDAPSVTIVTAAFVVPRTNSNFSKMVDS
jgi:hypothetical protein